MNLRSMPLFGLRLSHFNIKWIAPFILLFVLTQTAGLLHTEIHPFHEHTASCDLYEQLAQPINDLEPFAARLNAPRPLLSSNSTLVSVYDAVYQPYAYSRAPPLA